MSPLIVTISYILSPPQSTTSPTGLSSTATHEFPLKITLKPESSSTATESNFNYNLNAEEHYGALRETLANARETLGSELTRWRDAVGDGEKEKDGKSRKGKAGEEEEELDEEGEGVEEE